MSLCRRVLILMLLELLAAPTNTFAQASPTQATSLSPDATSWHSVNAGTNQLTYSAVAGTLPLFGAKAEVTANIFYTAYRVGDDATDRPITFVFNGGPGAASAFLQLAAMGPRAIQFTTNGAAALKPVQLVDNPDTWLDFTDLVFVDPVGTGYSRTRAGTDEADRAFHGVDKDADAIANFVQLYLTRTGRELAGISRR